MVNILPFSTEYDWNASEGEAGYVKNRTHYEETTIVNEPLNITWDGNTEGLVSVDVEDGVAIYKLSDIVLTNEQARTMKVVINTGEEFLAEDEWATNESQGLITEDFAVFGGFSVFVVRKGNVSIGGMVTIPEEGIWFVLQSAEYYPASLTTTEPIPQTKTVVKKLDKKFLPDEVGGGDMLKATYDTDGDGIVDNAEKLGGILAEAYAKKTDIPTIPTKVSAFENDKGYLTSYTETDPTVPSWAKASSKPTYTKSEVGLGNVDNVKQYSASNPPPYPVTSINGKTGAVQITASDLGLSGAMRFLGTSATNIVDNSTTQTISVNGSTITAQNGNVVLYGNKEFVWNNTFWEELGDEGSHALKSVKIEGTGFLTGGGTLEANRTIDINNTIKTKIYGAVQKSEAAGYNDILTKTIAASTYQPISIIKTTTTITPTEVKAFMDEGKAFVISHTDATYGSMLFNSFAYSQALDGVVASVMFETAGVKFCAQLSGGLTSNIWTFSAFQLAGAEDIPKAFYVTVTDNGDGTYTADKTLDEIKTAFNDGLSVYGIATSEGVPIIHNLTAIFSEDLYTIAIFGSSPIDGLMSTILMDGTSVDVATQNLSPELESLTIKIGNRTVVYDGTAGKVINVQSLKNPNALTINGKTYDGSEAVDMTTSEFVITLTGDETNGFTSDKPYSDIVEAYGSGRTLVCVWNGTRMPMVSFDNGMFVFMLAMPGMNMIAQVTEEYAIALSMSMPITIDGEVWNGEESKDFTDTINAMIDAKAKKGESIYYIVGNGDTEGVWTGTCEDITEYYDGLTIAYKTNISGILNGTTLNINSLGAISVRRNASTAVTTTYPAGSVIILTYSTTDGVGYWLTAGYDSDTKITTGTANEVAKKLYLVGGVLQKSSGSVTYTNKNCYIGTDNRLYSNGEVVPNTDEINALIDTKLGVIENGSY